MLCTRFNEIRIMAMGVKKLINIVFIQNPYRCDMQVAVNP
jgi:hypothetical protein